MDTNRIELDAIDILKNQLKISNRVVPFITSNDKTPSWDGHLFLQNQEEFSKDGYQIPVQIKGTLVERFSEKELKKSVDMLDIVNYRRQRGVLYIVVEMINRCEGKVFYEYLMPSDIHRYTKGKKNKKTVTIKLKALDISTATSVENVLRIFYQQSSWERPTTIDSQDIEIESGDGFEFIVNASPNEIQNYIFNNEIYLRSTKNVDGKKQDMATRVTFKQMNTEVIRKVIVGERVFYEAYIVEATKNGHVFIFGGSVRLAHEANKMYFEDVGTLDQRIRNLEFLFSLVTNKSLSIGGIDYIQDIEIHSDISVYRRIYEYLMDIKRLLLLFGVKKDFDLSVLTEQEMKNLNFIVKAKLYNEKIPIGNTKISLYNINIGPFSLTVFINVDDNGMMIVDDVFAKNYKANFVQLVFEEENKVVQNCSVLLLLNKKIMIESSNIDYNEIANSFCSMEINEYTGRSLNALVLEMISVFDDCVNFDALECAIKVLNCILDVYPNDEINRINLIQCFVRKRKLDIMEVETLLEIRNKSIQKENYILIWAVDVVLGNNIEAELYYAKMEPEIQEEMKVYPIYHLYCKSIGGV